MATLDVLIILAFVAHALYQGFSARRVASQNLEEYFLAGRSLPGWKAGLSMAATQFAADTPLFVTGLVATAGIFYLWRPFWIFALAFLLLGFVLSSSWRRAGVLTDAELAEVTMRASVSLTGRPTQPTLRSPCSGLSMEIMATPASAAQLASTGTKFR